MAAISRRDFLQKSAAAVVATLGSTVGRSLAYPPALLVQRPSLPQRTGVMGR